MRKSPGGFGVVLEGEISGVAGQAHLIDLHLGERQICIERTAASARLRNGDRVRVLLQQPFDGDHSHVTAFQRESDAAVHFAGPRLDLSLGVLGGLLLAAGIYTGIACLLIPASSLLLLRLLLACDRHDQLAAFRDS